MARSLLVRGLITGAIAGVLAFVFAYVFGEPQIDKAIAFEDHLNAINHVPAEPIIVSRGTQSTLGLFTGTFVMGVALGSIFSLVFAWAYGRMANLSARATAATLALGAYLAITLVPATKYPPTPPTIGSPDTIGRRTALFFAMIAISLLATVAAARVRRQLVPRLGSWNAAIVAGGLFVALIVIAEVILPSISETPRGFSPDVLWHFRIASLGINATLWASIGLIFGALAERVIEPREARQPVVARPTA
ncbi:MAG TPA: CbtA family protein [Conexibacter sp.]|jgi:hypothetical protein